MPFFTVPSFGIGWIISIVLIFGFSLTLQLIRNWNVEIDKVEEDIDNPVILKVILPQTNTTSPKDAENLFSMLHGIVGNRSKSYYHISFEFAETTFGTQFYVITPSRFKTFVTNHIYANYPNAEINETLDYISGITSRNNVNHHVVVAEIDLSKDFIFPIKTYGEFDYDPLSSLLASSGSLSEHEMIAFQILLRPVGSKWQKTGRSYLENLRQGIHPKGKKKFRKDLVKILKRMYEGVFSVRHLSIKPAVVLDKTQQDEISEIENKVSKQGYEFLIRVLANATSEQKSQELVTGMVSALSQFNSPHLNILNARIYSSNKDKDHLEEVINAYKSRQLELEANDILSTAEIASIYHFPNERVTASSISWAKAKKAEPPVNLPETTPIIGRTDYREQPKTFGILEDDRRRHMYVIGKTGSGKSTFLKQMIIQDIFEGKGVGIIDPHGELAEEILEYIPEERLNDVVYLDPSDSEFPPSLNLFSVKDSTEREYCAQAILEVFKKHFDSWGPRLEYILHNAILSLLYAEGSTMLGIQRILTDYSYRQYVLSYVTDPVLLRFWNEEYSQVERNSRLLSETIAPIQNKVGRFLTSAAIRHVVGQSKGKVDIEEILADKKIFICNLSQGKLGEEYSSLLGSLIVTRLQSAAMARVRLLDSQRPDFYLYVDEFQNFATTSFMKILSEARKYKLNLIIAHQYLGQINKDIEKAILGNVGTICTFTLGGEDSQIIEKEFFPTFSAHDLVSLEKYQFYIKMLINGFVVKPFSAQTFLMDFEKKSSRQDVINKSRNTYSSKKQDVEKEISEWNTKVFKRETAYTPRITRIDRDENPPLIDQLSS